MQGCKGPALFAGVFRISTICRAVKALHYMQGCTGPALYAGLYRPYTALRGMPALHYTQGFIGSIHRAL